LRDYRADVEIVSLLLLEKGEIVIPRVEMLIDRPLTCSVTR